MALTDLGYYGLILQTVSGGWREGSEAMSPREKLCMM